MYGREAESFDAVTQVFHQIMGKYPASKVLKAFEIWVEKSQEFPTPADIVGLIKRNGKPPLSKEMFIAISKKPGEDRTAEDWQYLRDFEADQRGETWGAEQEDRRKIDDLTADNAKLRHEIRRMQQEIERLSGIILEMKKGQNISTKIEIPMTERITKTIEFMRQTGSSEQDIEAFRMQQGVAA